MRTLSLGMSGDVVTAWQNFTLGADPYSDYVASGTFDQDTKAATAAFQQKQGLGADGEVGPATLARAQSMGFDPLQDGAGDFPPPPDFPPLQPADRAALFGTFSYVPAPTAMSPEAIRITDSWPADNIVTADLPQLAHVRGAPASCSVSCHKLVAPQLVKVWSDWEQAGLLPLVMTWAGSWAPRFIRGSRTSLSNHAWGTAFDINAQWNPLGARPAAKGQTGCTRDLVEIAISNGWYWGGWFGMNGGNRSDGMHFEAYKVAVDL